MPTFVLMVQPNWSTVEPRRQRHLRTFTRSSEPTSVNGLEIERHRALADQAITIGQIARRCEPCVRA